MKPKLVFFGNERLATGINTTAPILKSLITAGYNIAAIVISQEDALAGAKTRSAEPLAVATVAELHNIPLLVPPKLADAREQLTSYGAAAGILAAYGKIIPQSVIDIFPRGIINIHPSLLPAHRGSIPLEATILAGETQTGVSLMRLVREMDAGPIYQQAVLPLSGSETKQDLADKLTALGTSLLINNLPAILDGSLQPSAQSENGVSYDQRLTKDSGRIETSGWNKPAIQIERMVRAFAGWPRVRTTLAGYDIIITAAHSIPATFNGATGALWLHGREVGVYTQNGILVIDKLIVAGKKEMPSSAFLAGYKISK